MPTYLRVEFRRTLRNPRYLLFTLAMPVIFYLVFSKSAGDADGAMIDGIPFPVFFLVSMAAYSGSLAATFAGGPRLAIERTSGWTAQLRVTPLPTWGYLSTKVLTAMALALPAIGLVSVVAALTNPIHLSAGRWVAMILGTWLATVPFAALGIMIGYLLDPSSAQPVTVLSLVGMSILGGLFTPPQALPPTMHRIAEVLPTYHMGQIGWHAVAGLSPALVDVAVLAAWTVVFAMVAAWRYQRAAVTA
jgi:ABC-2 type transport system permease protein